MQRVHDFRMLVDNSTRVRTLPVRSAENIATVAKSLREQPSTSSCRPSQELIISCSSFRILHKDLVLKPYTIQLVQAIDD